MEPSAKYNPSQVEDKWYAYWLRNRCFHSEPDSREPYTIVIPPPNVTGILHMGHVLNNTLNDVLIRKARMDGKNACWVPGTDHASIATESKVVARLASQGIKKEDLTREQFLEHAWAWKEEHGGIILEQLRKLGASCDWDRTRFTMDPDLSAAVTATFVYFYKKGLIYHGYRMVNWDPVAHTAISDDEVIHRDTKSHFYHLRYFISDGAGHPTSDFLTIATTRPETIMADSAICVNPADGRYRHLRGKKVFIPLINREIPVIEDDYVEMDFGTGCLKVTPAHDAHDYEIGQRHNLPIIEILDDDGRLTPEAQILVGEDRFVARKKICKMLEDAGNLVKVEEYVSPIGYSERTDAVIEPKLSKQWFLKLEDLAAEALDKVESGKIKFIPDKYRNVYRHWMENAHDWCISRQLWWGQRIPAWYLPDGRIVVEETADKALASARELDPALRPEDLRQDEDVLDTWFSSWLWPISVFDPERPGHPEHAPNADLSYYYPTNDLVTGPDILFFWVARMIMAGNEFMDKEPFRNVYLTGIVRDKIGRKMSKTLGNSPDPLDLIAKYGADAVRIGMLLCSSAGNDIFYDESQVEQGRNFCNKIWNSYRLVKSFEVDASAPQKEAAEVAVKWFDARLSQVIETVEDHYSKFRISDALMAIYKLFWDDYCSWYLEAIKPAFVDGVAQKLDCKTYDATLRFFDSLLRLIHPVMPFISEELWQNMEERAEGESIMYASTPKPGAYDPSLINDFEIAEETVNGIRGLRNSKNLPPKEFLTVRFKGDFPEEMIPLVAKLSNSSLEKAENFGDEAGAGFMVRTIEMFVPLKGLVNAEEEIAKIEKDLEYQHRFLDSVRKKLANEQFTSHAPATVVENERKKEADSISKIESLESQLNILKNNK